MPVERVREILKISQEPVSLETQSVKRKTVTWEILFRRQCSGTAEAAAQTLLKEQLDEVLDTSDRERAEVLRLRFGMDDGSCTYTGRGW